VHNHDSPRQYQLAVVVPDLHVPHEDKRSVAALEQYLADEKWDYWICLGDLIDNEAVSAFNVGKPRKIMTAPTVLEQFSEANRFLDRHLAAATKNNPDCKLVYIEGNHEERCERYVDKAPELQGLVDVERALKLKERNVQYVRFWSRGDLYQLGKLYVGHGAYTVQNHAAKHVRDFGCNLIYGHSHDVQMFTIKQRGKNQTLMGQSLGCLCAHDQPYMRGRPTNWSTAFGIVYLHADGIFQHQVVMVNKFRFVGPTTGKLYQG
jgi:predicted phosphodiesterase